MASTSKTAVKTEVEMAEPDVVEEIPNAEEVLDAKILQLLQSNVDGLSNKDLQQALLSTTAQNRGQSINRLLARQKIQMVKIGSGPGDFKLKIKNQLTVDKLKDASPEETVVYGVIEEAGNKGVWKRVIHSESGLSETKLNKVLKALEGRKLVKSINSIGSTKRKMYMLFETEPDISLTGDSFFSDQEFDSQFADLLNEQCLKFLKSRFELALEKHPENLLLQRRASLLSSNEVWQHINNMKISRVDLSLQDIERVLDTVVYDGNAEKVPPSKTSESNGDRFGYRYRKGPLTGPSGLARTPCLFCPVFNDCQPGHAISPETCVYFTDWLNDI